MKIDFLFIDYPWLSPVVKCVKYNWRLGQKCVNYIGQPSNGYNITFHVKSRQKSLLFL